MPVFNRDNQMKGIQLFIYHKKASALFFYLLLFRLLCPRKNKGVP